MYQKKDDQLLLEQPSPVTTEVDKYTFEPIKGFPMLNWRGKRPFNGTQYFPAQRKEIYGEEVDGWINKIFWGDNLQVMSHLLKEYRGKVDLIYIDPPFDSKADYKKNIKMRGRNLSNDLSNFEEKQYTDIWNNDDYLQFMYERLLVARELLSVSGSLVLHCDYHKNSYLRSILDEIFSPDNLVNEICWRRKGGTALGSMKRLSASFDTLLWYSKSQEFKINPVFTEAPREYINTQFKYVDDSGRRYMITVMRSPSPRPNLMYDYKGYKMPPNGWAIPMEKMAELDRQGLLHFPDSKEKQIYKKIYLDEYKGHQINSLWTDISTLKGSNSEIENYPTQKPLALLNRIINLTTDKKDLVLDFFMGSGTTQVAAMKLERRFIGADINLGAIETTTKRLIQRAKELEGKSDEDSTYYTGFEVYNVNHYDVFRNPVQAKELLIEALEIQPLTNSVYDGEKEGKKVKIMPVNRIATREDLNELIANLPYKQFAKKHEEAPNKPVEHLLLVCMGHEPNLAAHLQSEVGYKLDVEVVDILRDKSDLQFKRDSEAKVVVRDGKLVIDAFYPMNLMQKLSQQKEDVSEWRELVESIKIDWNYDGAAMEPAEVDVPGKNEFVKGEYAVPADAGTIKIKITDLLSESWEGEIEHG